MEEKQGYWGMSVSVDVKNCDDDIIRSAERIKQYVKELVDLIDMKAWGECHVHNFGTGNKEGISFVQLIETSNIVGHLANESNSAYIDVFSCKMFDPSVVAEFTQNYFAGDSVTVHTTIRR